MAAIPATIFYNIFVARIDNVRAEIDLFCEEFAEDVAKLGTGVAPRGVR
jgi:biopolymer transport protein ExbB/TolQ